MAMPRRVMAFTARSSRRRPTIQWSSSTLAPATCSGTRGPGRRPRLLPRTARVRPARWLTRCTRSKFILIESERAELQAIDDNINGAANSDARMNTTFISIDGTGSQLRYLGGVRNRGHGTRTAKPNNFRIDFRSDDEWKGVTALNINAQFTWLQVIGSALHLKSGIVGAYSRAVQVRVNNVNLAFSGPTDRTYGSYAANEAVEADWADRHFPNDSNGNVYRALRDLVPSDFDYRTLAAYPGLSGPEDKNSYTNTWFKTTNVSEDDWTDLIAMLRIFGLNGTEPFTPENVRKVINVEQWLRHLAMMNLLGNNETGLNTGYNDDYFMYRGTKDRRFILMYYDLDTILGFNGALAPNGSLFSATSTGNLQRSGPAFDRFLHQPEFEPIYYAMLQELIDTTFAGPQFNALVDEVLGDFVPEATRSQLKSWMDSRRTFVQSQLPVVTLGKPPVAVVTGVPRSPTPRGTVSLVVDGEGVTHYRFSLNGGTLGIETPVATPISLAGLPNGTNTVAVIGRNAFSWVVNTAWPAVRLNEIIASRSGNLRDQIELYNEGAATLALSGMRLTDDPGNPSKFTFGPTNLAAGAYLVMDASQVGFSLEKSGEGVFLFDSAARGGALLDSVAFGLQITDLSIGRTGQSGDWQLTQPTFGSKDQ
ncbi:MAG: hypothetical protein DME26_12340 [Verrucomicrobia bacterium]|nr:MAG: hypothetical protein DME26_12340 [Verrucomicrobiota bacterium]